ncbi:N-acetyl-gamma-glutamyl-phosphate reductase [Pseudovibrio sp. SPO723]|uniref:N-acetyl-gamma-glutamyl-phosphate reductase n=1 Tax=Nesiotobacter zosterae TaxID=392721 RepID=UPI0029C3CF08|nr:N-acetyl-gamma-glutamyl-phosphate reductase [Pseudovibrio sp. SPO723]MDX5592053.1 N-acetyl-gamma-glutamyl-phosphate reductase [Pseudovibrio sp. SPO723]
MTARVFIDGEAGTTGLQIRERLAGRRDIELISIDPARRKELSARAELLNAADVAILCLPDDAAKESVSLIENSKTKVIDASTAHRVDPEWNYGFAEMAKGQKQAIAEGRFVSNPGCYPQGLIATVRPLVEGGLIPADFPLTMNAISGYSGGGRQMIETYESEAQPAPYMPYALGFNHKHLPEMQLNAKLDVAPLFQPAVGNYAQGMVTCIPLQLSALKSAPSGKTLHEAISDYYADSEGFVEVAPFEAVQKVPELNPETFNGTNTMRLYVFANDDRAQAVLMAVYDNLGKGASGAAVQNLNLMLGIDQKSGLTVD